MKLRYKLIGSLIVAISLSSVSALDNFPNHIKQASEADKARFELCPVGYISSDADLRHFCKGVK